MGKKHREGFTLIELLVLVMVMAITLGIGVPAFVSMAANARMSGAANDLVASLRAARAEASARGRTVTLCASSSWDDAAPDCDAGASLPLGWIVFADTDADGVMDAGEALLQVHGPLDPGIATQPATGTDADAVDYVAFRPDGVPASLPGLGTGLRNIQLCDARGDSDTGGGRAAGRWIAITPSGRTQLADSIARLQGDANPLGGC